MYDVAIAIEASFFINEDALKTSEMCQQQASRSAPSRLLAQRR